MRIELENAGRKFNRDWILRGVNLTLEAGNVYVVTGPNGSGKSTFLQLIAGNLPLTERLGKTVQGQKCRAGQRCGVVDACS